jgi:cytochrome c peroxidase
MPLFNLAWKSSFFWDGRAPSLREQVLQPIQDHREMACDLPTVIARLTKTSRADFDKAFGPGEITAERIALALENFLLTLTSYDSKFDRAMSGKAKLTPAEERDMKLFFTEYEPRSQQFGADCFHCHGGANFSDHQFHDNGLGGNFSTPSLRNIGLTAPYMHDGRFATLKEVIAHYSGPMTRSEALDPNLAKHPRTGLQFSKENQAALVAFLKTLTDPKYAR